MVSSAHSLRPLLFAGMVLGLAVGRVCSAPYPQAAPTDEEQWMLELMNRARANPSGEAARLGIGLNDGLSAGTLSNFTRQPLAMHPSLLASSRGHSQWVLDTDTFSHTGVDGSNSKARMEAAGYVFSGGWSYAENLSLNADVVSAHDALFRSSGHRVSILNDQLDEAGAGLKRGDFGGDPTLMSTIDFGVTGATPGPLITGVVYFDLNGNGRYDGREGVGGVTVAAAGTTWTALTGTAGGFALPVPGAGNYPVTFSAPNLAPAPVSVAVAEERNRKLDLAPAYLPPVPAGTGSMNAGGTSAYVFGPVPAATGYDAAFARYTAGTYFEGAESGTGGLVPSVAGGYALVQSAVRAGGSSAFHLAHPQAVDQLFTLVESFRPSSASSLTFNKRLSWAMPGQIARAEVSTDQGANWVAVWSQAGNGNAGDSGFSQVTTPLSAYAGREVRVRFVYDYSFGSYYPQTSSGIGFYVDDIQVTAAQLLAEEETTPLGTSSGFSFSPDSGGTWLLRVRALLPGRALPWGPSTVVNVGGGVVDPPDPPPVDLAAPAWVSARRVKTKDVLAWSTVGGAASYVVERLESGLWKRVFEGGGTSVTIAMKKALARKTATYRLQAVDAQGGRSDYSPARSLP